jgi:hypothetical protein
VVVMMEINEFMSRPIELIIVKNEWNEAIA